MRNNFINATARVKHQALEQQPPPFPIPAVPPIVRAPGLQDTRGAVTPQCANSLFSRSIQPEQRLEQENAADSDTF